MSRCKLCNGKGHTVEKGKQVVCKCRLIPQWESKLGNLARCGMVSDRVKQVVKKLIDIKPPEGKKAVPKHYYIIDNDRAENKPRNWYKGFFAYYLVKSMEFMDFKLVEFSMLNEAFFSDKSDAASMSNEVRYFDLPNNTIILVCSGKPSSRISADILRTFLDTYQNKDVFIYFSKEACSGPKKLEWDGGVKQMVQVEQFPGLDKVLQEGNDYGFINVTERWSI